MFRKYALDTNGNRMYVGDMLIYHSPSYPDEIWRGVIHDHVEADKVVINWDISSGSMKIKTTTPFLVGMKILNAEKVCDGQQRFRFE